MVCHWPVARARLIRARATSSGPGSDDGAQPALTRDSRSLGALHEERESK